MMTNNDDACLLLLSLSYYLFSHSKTLKYITVYILEKGPIKGTVIFGSTWCSEM